MLPQREQGQFDFLCALCGVFASFAVQKLLTAKGRKVCRKVRKETAGRAHASRGTSVEIPAVLRKVPVKKRKTFPKQAFAGQMLSHYERAVIKAED